MNWQCENWLELLKALGPLFIGAYVAYIATQQWKVNRANLREKLFDRRMQVYEGTKDFYVSMIAAGDCTDEELNKFSAVLASSMFLFPEELREKLLKFRRLGVDFQYTKKSNADRWLEIANELPSEFDQLIEAFKPFMSFDDIE